jgi:hypothetical protein
MMAIIGIRYSSAEFLGHRPRLADMNHGALRPWKPKAATTIAKPEDKRRRAGGEADE